MPLEPAIAREIAAALPRIMPGLLVVSARIARYHRSEDLVQEACLRILEGTRVWNREEEPDLFHFVCGVMRSIDNGRAERAQREVTSIDAWISRAATPEELTKMKELHELFMRTVEMIRQKLREGDLKRMVLELRYVEGVDEPAEVAARLEVDVKRVYKANEWVENELKRSLSRFHRYAPPPPDFETTVRDVAAMQPQAIDAELRRHGYDPARVAADAAAMAATFAGRAGST
jgi:DNA-directed RNA polymerase specialized sigma24 family protein